jgi:adenylylsulfate kinase-like enzyme
VEAADARGPDAAALKELLVLVSGPIASGKSTLSRAVVRVLRDAGISAAAVDVDVVYELLEERGYSPGRAEMWSRARRVAGRLAGALFAEGVDVVLVEGGFLAAEEQSELLAEVQPDRVRRILLHTSLETALARVRLDADRGVSRDPVFLAQHYGQIGPAAAPRLPGELVFHTDSLSVEDGARRIVAWLNG